MPRDIEVGVEFREPDPEEVLLRFRDLFFFVAFGGTDRAPLSLFLCCQLVRFPIAFAMATHGATQGAWMSARSSLNSRRSMAHEGSRFSKNDRLKADKHRENLKEFLFQVARQPQKFEHYIAKCRKSEERHVSFGEEHSKRKVSLEAEIFQSDQSDVENRSEDSGVKEIRARKQREIVSL